MTIWLKIDMNDNKIYVVDPTQLGQSFDDGDGLTDYTPMFLGQKLIH